MSENILPPLRYCLPMTTIRRERRLPVAGTVTVRVNERLMAQDVVAEAEPGHRRLFIDLARGLGVDEDKVATFLRKQVGERVEAGAVIAGPVGVARRTVRAPSDCRIVAIVGGKMLLEERGRPLHLRAGIPGIVISTDGVRSVILETTGAIVQGVWGNGRQEFGVMRLAGKRPDLVLSSELLGLEARGAILVAGMCQDAEPLEQARKLLLRGLVLGGLSARLIPLVREMPYPVVVLEGFGSLPISQVAYDILATNSGREVALDARQVRPYEEHRPEILIPLPAGEEFDVPSDIVPLARGVRVQVLRPPHRGAIGVVKELPPQAMRFASGAVARCAVVDLQGIGPKPVPLSNLEVVP
jgi:hypothetical protein